MEPGKYPRKFVPSLIDRHFHARPEMKLTWVGLQIQQLVTPMAFLGGSWVIGLRWHFKPFGHPTEKYDGHYIYVKYSNVLGYFSLSATLSLLPWRRNTYRTGRHGGWVHLTLRTLCETGLLPSKANGGKEQHYDDLKNASYPWKNTWCALTKIMSRDLLHDI